MISFDTFFLCICTYLYFLRYVYHDSKTAVANEIVQRKRLSIIVQKNMSPYIDKMSRGGVK